MLENLHVSSAFKIILTDDANILANLSKEEYRYEFMSSRPDCAPKSFFFDRVSPANKTDACPDSHFLHSIFRELVIEMVLATDMTRHFEQIKTMKALLNHGDLVVDKGRAMSLILHCCDISHPAKEFQIHERWTTLLMEEFFRQVRSCPTSFPFTQLSALSGRQRTGTGTPVLAAM